MNKQVKGNFSMLASLEIMVFVVIDDNPEKGAHACSGVKLDFFLDREQSQIWNLFQKSPVSLHTNATCPELPSNIRTILELQYTLNLMSKGVI